MRPINSEPLLKEIRRLKEKAETFRHQDFRCGYIYALSDVEKQIASTPTIDAEPVRHGWWERYLSDPFCSECGEFAETVTNFCPNCGAKMDLEV